MRLPPFSLGRGRFDSYYTMLCGEWQEKEYAEGGGGRFFSPALGIQQTACGIRGGSYPAGCPAIFGSFGRIPAVRGRVLKGYGVEQLDPLGVEKVNEFHSINFKKRDTGRHEEPCVLDALPLHDPAASLSSDLVFF